MHAYLEGVGIELMANSDNVLRGGLTGKHMDTDELMRVVDFDPSPIQILHPVEKSDCESYYPTEAEEFLLSKIQTAQQKNYMSPDAHGLEILLCLEGPATILRGPDYPDMAVEKGQSILVPASSGKYRIEGKSMFFKASIPA
jgi:mannose-6-phosphate isomerase